MEEIILEIGEKICPNCGIIHNKRGKCHNKACGYEYRKRRNTIWKRCGYCGMFFPTESGHIKQGRGKHCGITCAFLSWLEDTPNRAKKISKSLLGREITWGDKISQTLTGTTLPEEHKKKISDTCKIVLSDPEMIERTKHYGPENGMFNNYSSYEPYTKEFDEHRKEECRNMYNGKCVVCGITKDENGRRLDVHHIDYNKLNSELWNLYPLCMPCHCFTKVPDEGIKNSWYEWFTMMKWEEELGLR